jgi:hypothetical protein
MSIYLALSQNTFYDREYLSPRSVSTLFLMKGVPFGLTGYLFTWKNMRFKGLRRLFNTLFFAPLSLRNYICKFGPDFEVGRMCYEVA